MSRLCPTNPTSRASVPPEIAFAYVASARSIALPRHARTTTLTVKRFGAPRFCQAAGVATVRSYVRSSRMSRSPVSFGSVASCLRVQPLPLRSNQRPKPGVVDQYRFVLGLSPSPSFALPHAMMLLSHSGTCTSTVRGLPSARSSMTLVVRSSSQAVGPGGSAARAGSAISATASAHDHAQQRERSQRRCRGTTCTAAESDLVRAARWGRRFGDERLIATW